MQENLSVANRSPDEQKRWVAAYEAIYQHPYYFRDSYNDSSLFWKLELSWWNDLRPYLGPDGTGTGPGDEHESTLYPPGITKLKAEIIKRAELLTYNVRDLPPSDQEYFLRKYDQFLDFLTQAVEGGHTILCSV
jgi:hypothetical protein